MKILYLIFLPLLCNTVKSDIMKYFTNIGTYFGYSNKELSSSKADLLDQNVPYEVSIMDEKFISEAAKLTGVVLSELDSCQHRVVLKLQTSCDRMNDEQLAKMAVMLLNCQSAVEGRKIYPCTDEMTIKDCTSTMDPDVWNSYHLMSNRARAVCYSVRQVQFRGLTEYTINRLMDAARDQLRTLDKITKDQENLHDLAEESLQSVALGQEQLKNQQKDLQMAQLHGQLTMENNIKRLVQEKQLILETHDQLIQMSQAVQTKLEDAAVQLKMQAGETQTNHQEILDDLIAIQNKAQIIFQRIEDSSNLLLKQSELARTQYEATLHQLAEVNATVHSLVSVVGDTRRALEDRLAWLNTALGGTDVAIERLYVVTWHVGFLLLAMIGCAFLGAPMSTRFIVASVPPLNLSLTLQQYSQALNPLTLTITLGALLTAQTIFIFSFNLWKNNFPQMAIPWIKQKITPQKSKLKDNAISTYVVTSTKSVPVSNGETHKYISKSSTESEYDPSEERDSFDFASPISRNRYASRSRSQTPLNLNGSIRGTCSAKTRQGLTCKLSAVPGRDFCHRHQTGDSICLG